MDPASRMQVCHQVNDHCVAMFPTLGKQSVEQETSRNYPTYHHSQGHIWGKSCFLCYHSSICRPIGPAFTRVWEKCYIKF